MYSHNMLSIHTNSGAELAADVTDICTQAELPQEPLLSQCAELQKNATFKAGKEQRKHFL